MVQPLVDTRDHIGSNKGSVSALSCLTSRISFRDFAASELNLQLSIVSMIDQSKSKPITNDNFCLCFREVMRFFQPSVVHRIMLSARVVFRFSSFS